MRLAREAHMQGQDVRKLEQRLLARGRRVSCGCGFLQRGFLTPDENIHSEPSATLRDQLPNGAETKNPEGRSAQAMRQRARPLSALHALGFERYVATGRDDQCKGKLGRGNR